MNITGPNSFFMQLAEDWIQSPLKFIRNTFRICLNVIRLHCCSFLVTWHVHFLRMNTSNSEYKKQHIFWDCAPDTEISQLVKGRRLFLPTGSFYQDK